MSWNTDTKCLICPSVSLMALMLSSSGYTSPLLRRFHISPTQCPLADSAPHIWS